ncbi:MAG: zinc ABC transporter substrate-binding protein [Propionibacteriaceae bacterium]|jgi:zinc transport system substrate-binding protein|nr:zinc ABC transporter substrate-binding protein [Propionibacteriaceae bacterium]
MFRRVTLAAVAALVTLGATACAAAGPAAPATGASDAVTVVVGLYPFEYLAARVGGDQVALANLTQPGAEPHDLELTARQVAAVAEADVVVYLSGLQPAVDDAVAQGQPAHAVDVADVVELVALTGPGAEAGDADDDHALSGLDPHVWLDPERMVDITAAIAGALAAADPDHAADYQANAATVSAELQALDQAYRTGLADCDRDAFVTAHAAFGYLADRYGLVQVPIAGLAPDAEPSPARVAAVQALAREYGVTTIFFETLASPALAETIAGDLGLTTAVLDPIEGITDQSAAPDYPGLMEANLAALRQANGCR